MGADRAAGAECKMKDAMIKKKKLTLPSFLRKSSRHGYKDGEYNQGVKGLVFTLTTGVEGSHSLDSTNHVNVLL